jgi:hypothetical protein
MRVRTHIGVAREALRQIDRPDVIKEDEGPTMCRSADGSRRPTSKLPMLRRR